MNFNADAGGHWMQGATARARAFALLIADAGRSAARLMPDVDQACRSAIRDAWLWTSGQGCPATQLHQHGIELDLFAQRSENKGELAGDQRRRNGALLYYLSRI